ncbi:MAG: type II toxin-antitoxin system HicB family antitoxin [Candidatus Magnetobacterium sp. LHC-1]|uniref:Type II toxin-antitoxin system HicB family antitoxin n=1 Tax=Candidatus Magnetobacterium casense TaxID=1455061 RepID=A0ABS6RX72_9BACT|nr:type II toxin-antitoxin system HicB family antitoxin [Candidatus Magnetobacterium casensis]MBF0607575.1 type II toxin-antitoxin system HicB family antitoxin [Nitrospirota bacterium]MBV6341237.1 type II toxin-antitoxin system HicB family antitoxin [Candidatus Magnetobacterium casensis]
MKVKATFVKDGKWWVAWTNDVPGAMTQGKTIEEARENLVDAIREMQLPYDIENLPNRKVIIEEMEV